VSHYTSPTGVIGKIFVKFLRPSNWFLAATIPWLIYIVLLCPVLGLAADFTVLVVSVLDGDIFEVLHSNRLERIRLSGIDCPEKGQAYGTRAQQAASRLVLGGEVTLQTYGKDKYGRTIADVLLLDGTNVNHTLVEDGWCWWYRKYAPGDTVLEALEAEARVAKKGLWADPQPVPPWEWRRRENQR
jgi:micrococcal nuclease